MWQKYKSGNNLPSKIYLRWGGYHFCEGKILPMKVNIVLTPIRTPLQRGSPGKIIRCTRLFHLSVALIFQTRMTQMTRIFFLIYLRHPRHLRLKNESEF